MGYVLSKSLLSGIKIARWRRVFIPVIILLGLAAFTVPGLSLLGRWLVIADPLDHARTIVVLSGHIPFRAMEAASIYRQGWAPEVWLTKTEETTEETALERVGIHVTSEQTYNREVLERLGVPESAIRLLDIGARNTVGELKVIARELTRLGERKAILVTSKPHSRRVRATWRALIGNSPRAMVRYSKEDPYQPERWWRHTQDALAVSREVLGMMNVWAGFPVRPNRR